MLMGGWGMQRQRHGEQTHWMLVTLASMLGQLVYLVVVSVKVITIQMAGYQRRQVVLLALFTATPISKPGVQTWLDDTSKSAFPLARIVDVFAPSGKKIQYNGMKLLTRTSKRYIGQAATRLFTIKIPIP